MAIKGQLREELTMDSILSRVSEYDIYRHFYGDFELNQVTKSPFSVDNHPSFVIGNKYGSISHIAFNDTSKRGDCFSFVKQLYNLSSLNEALEKIDTEMGLGFRGVKKDYKKVISEYKQPEVTKRNTVIQVTTRRFTKEELDYWNQFSISLDDLKKNNIYSIKVLYLNKAKFSLKETDLRFGYFYPEYMAWKIYRPLLGKKDKWLPNNVPITALDGKDNIKNCDTAFINKSRKDKMIIEKLFPCSCAVQNEGVACFSQENVEFLKSNSKRQILSFDADAPGVANSQQITKMFGFDYLNVPRKYLENGAKDWGDVTKQFGLNEVEKILKEKNLI